MPDLLAPIVPSPDTSSLQYVARGLSQMVANRQHQQNYELAYQKMVQDSALDQAKFGLAREQLAQQYQLQQAQIANLHSEVGLHNAQAGYWENYKGQEAKQKQENLNYVKDYTNEVAKIPIEQWGTNDAANQLALLGQQFSMISEIPGGRAVMNQSQIRQRTRENSLAKENVTLNTRYQSTLRGHGLGPLAMEKLQVDDAGKFIPNDYWGVNADGAPFLATLPTRDNYGRIVTAPVVPPSEVAKLAKGDKKRPAYEFTTLSANEAHRLLEMKSKIDAFANGQGAPPIEATQSAVQQQVQVNSQDEAIGDAIRWLQEHPDDTEVRDKLKAMGKIP